MSYVSLTAINNQDTTKDTAKIFGVDLLEIQANPGIAAPGWVYKKDLGNGRIQWETIVAMKTPPTETADDADVPDVNIIFTVQPVTSTISTHGAGAFSLTATSAPLYGLTYQWQVSATQNGSYANISNGSVYAGVTTASMTVTNETDLDNMWYRCAVTGNGVTEYSDPAKLDITITINVSSQPVAASVAAPNPATFTVVAAASPSGTLAYQWQVSSTQNGTYANIANGAVYAAVTTASMTVSNSTGLNSKWYRCAITTSDVTVNSTAVQLTVT